MRSFSVRSQLMAGFGLVIAVFVAASILVSIQFSKNRENTRWTSHTYEVLIESQNLLTALVNIETGQRGYLLAGTETFLEPLRQGEEDFNRAYERVLDLTSDNSAQQQRLRDLYSQYESWKNNAVDEEVEVRRTITQDEDASFSEVIQMVREERGKSGMDSMRSIIQAITEEDASY